MKIFSKYFSHKDDINTMNIAVLRGRRVTKMTLDEFHKEYSNDLTPKCLGDKFYILQQDGRNYMIYDFPNPICAFIDGQFKYVIYKGNSTTIINGVLQPNFDFLDENQVFASEDDALSFIREIEERESGKTLYIDIPDGRRIKLNQ